MASEQKIRDVLDLLTTTNDFQIESLDYSANYHAKSLRGLVKSKNIVAIGIAEKRTNEDKTGKLALTFYVKKKVALNKLMADEAIPATVPDALTGNLAVPTDVVVIGDIVPEINATRNPVQPGNSIGHPDVTCGTLGAIVAKGKEYFVLSNSHVLANKGKAQIGDTIVYPGIADGGAAPADQLGTLADFIQFIKGPDYVNKTDCAIAKISPERVDQILAEIKGKNFPKGTIKAKRGMKVFKVGRTTEYTEGEVRDIDVRVPVPYGGSIGEIRFTNQVLCSNFTDGGDSGSLVIDMESGKAVGLHFCGSPAASIFNPIQIVLDELKVKLVTSKINKD